ncbi:MAG: hypothetical protein II109_04865, partial [Paludibacteraceae bacterium]|nr:hypothetical protein [Paludibacteraceae bacterium]
DLDDPLFHNRKLTMLQKILRELRDRPILSIILCVVLSEIIQLIITVISKRHPSYHYGIAVMALLVLFVMPVVLYIIKRRGEKKAESDNRPDENNQ